MRLVSSATLTSRPEVSLSFWQSRSSWRRHKEEVGTMAVATEAVERVAVTVEVETEAEARFGRGAWCVASGAVRGARCAAAGVLPKAAGAARCRRLGGWAGAVGASVGAAVGAAGAAVGAAEGVEQAHPIAGPPPRQRQLGGAPS